MTGRGWEVGSMGCMVVETFAQWIYKRIAHRLFVGKNTTTA